MKSWLDCDAEIFRYHPFRIGSEDDYQHYMGIFLHTTGLLLKLQLYVK